jgi:hypothetical protein
MCYLVGSSSDKCVLPALSGSALHVVDSLVAGHVTLLTGRSVCCAALPCCRWCYLQAVVVCWICSRSLKMHDDKASSIIVGCLILWQLHVKSMFKKGCVCSLCNMRA